MNPKPEIAVLVVGPANRETGGIARYIAAQHEHLPPSVRMETYDVAPSADGKGRWWLARELLHAGKRALRFPFQSRPDIVHVHTSHERSFYLSSWFVFVSRYLWRRPTVLHVHGSAFDTFVQSESWLVRVLQRRVFAAATAIIVLSVYWKHILEPVSGRTQLFVLPNAIDPDEYDPHFDVTPPHVVFISNHVERKGIREFVTAVEQLTDAGLAFRVTIAGKGPLSHLAEGLAARYQSVSYVGYVSEAEKRALLDSASIYVLPTHAEGLPIGILEAMAGGNAILSTPVGSIPELIRAENGRLVTPGAADALTAALSALLADPKLVRNMAQRNRTLVEEGYTWQEVAVQLTALYARLLGRPYEIDRDTPPVVIE
ncbi:glycosyltransferase family 4 protein [Haladaptatus sp. DJG-WS-42]|uniref:glycosyltransferase family 4 protein n=1 Tax=Haladaptatus sp. DJG-WS-42 TaxID=3120516 RepID=UPI0030D14ABD